MCRAWDAILITACGRPSQVTAATAGVLCNTYLLTLASGNRNLSTSRPHHDWGSKEPRSAQESVVASVEAVQKVDNQADGDKHAEPYEALVGQVAHQKDVEEDGCAWQPRQGPASAMSSKVRQGVVGNQRMLQDAS